jgi:TetR/AcrR family transcriptional regulator, mexJK operon transcriptional repressor
MTCPKQEIVLPCAESASVTQKVDNMRPARAVGRPKDMEKRCAILSAALKLFSDRGLDGVPMEAIAAEAGVSKVTVYANFKDKNAIIAAIVERQSERLDEILSEAMQTEGDLAEKLTRVGTSLFDLLAEPSHRAIERCLTMEKLRNPELARKYFDAGPGHLRDRLAELMADAMKCGAMNLDCSRMAAEDLLGLWLGFSGVERRYKAEMPPSEDLRARVKRGVDFFIRAHAA